MLPSLAKMDLAGRHNPQGWGWCVVLTSRHSTDYLPTAEEGAAAAEVGARTKAAASTQTSCSTQAPAHQHVLDIMNRRAGAGQIEMVG
jgi:hypothetical protein